MAEEHKGKVLSFREASDYEGAHDETVIAFVDLVGSTEYWFTSPAIATFTVVQIFHNLVLETAWTYGGRPIKGIGDEVMLRFDEPDSSTACRKAVLAAVAIQKKLREDGRVQKAKTEKGLFCKIVIHRVKNAVRVGYHEGDLPKLIALEKTTRARRGAVKIPEAYARDLLGHHVNLAARINKVVEADQILISQDAFTLIQDQIEALRNELSVNALGEIGFSEILTIHGFRGIDQGVQILSIGQLGEVRPPKYPVGSIVLLSLRTGSTASRELFNKYLTAKEIEARRSWAFSIKGCSYRKLNEDFAFKVGGLDLLDLERFIGDVFYGQQFHDITEKTETIFLRQIRDDSHRDVLQCIVKDPLPYQQLWMVKLRELTARASAEPFERWLAKKLGIANVRLHDYQRTWGEFEACVLLSGESEEALEIFRTTCIADTNTRMDPILSKLFSAVPPLSI